jgi:hypothetical protein
MYISNVYRPIENIFIKGILGVGNINDKEKNVITIEKLDKYLIKDIITISVWIPSLVIIFIPEMSKVYV